MTPFSVLMQIQEFQVYYLLKLTLECKLRVYFTSLDLLQKAIEKIIQSLGLRNLCQFTRN